MHSLTSSFCWVWSSQCFSVAQDSHTFVTIFTEKLHFLEKKSPVELKTEQSAYTKLLFSLSLRN